VNTTKNPAAPANPSTVAVYWVVREDTTAQGAPYLYTVHANAASADAHWDRLCDWGELVSVGKHWRMDGPVCERYGRRVDANPQGLQAQKG
jgi:hypothetical protein